jgi:hypothetical protein
LPRLFADAFTTFDGCPDLVRPISVDANLEGSLGNTVSGVSVLNTILWNNVPTDSMLE